MLGHEGLESSTRVFRVSSLKVVRIEGPVANIGMPEVTFKELELQATEAANAGIVFAPTMTITQLVEAAVAFDKAKAEDPQKA